MKRARNGRLVNILEPERFLPGPSVWSAGPAFLVRMAPGRLRSEETRALAQRLASRVEGVEEHPVFRRRRDLPAAAAALADLLTQAVIGLRWGRSEAIEDGEHVRL